MARNTVTKSLARFTRPLRGLFNRKEIARLTRIPRTLLTQGGVGARLIELENRFERLQRGWNQHIPGLLDSMSDALDAAHHAEDGHRRIDSIREDLDRLSSRLEIHLLDVRSSRQAGYGEVGHPLGVTLSLAEPEGVIFVSTTRDLQVAPGSIGAIAVSAAFKFESDGEGLDEMLAQWSDLLAPDGQIEIQRFHLVDMLEASGPENIDFGALRRATACGGLMGSPELPTNDQIINALKRRGFKVTAGSASDGIVQIITGHRQADPGA